MRGSTDHSNHPTAGNCQRVHACAVHQHSTNCTAPRDTLPSADYPSCHVSSVSIQIALSSTNVHSWLRATCLSGRRRPLCQQRMPKHPSTSAATCTHQKPQLNQTNTHVQHSYLAVHNTNMLSLIQLQAFTCQMVHLGLGSSHSV